MRGFRQLLKMFGAWDTRGDAIPFDDLMDSLRTLTFDHNDLNGALIFGDRHYRRVAIHRRPHYEALVLCWRSGQRSPIHNHRGSSCVVKVVEGRATETEYVPSPCGLLVPKVSRTHPSGSVSACCDDAVDQMANLEAAGHDLITLHVYSPPPVSWNYFELNATVLADHDALLHEGNPTVVVDFGRLNRQCDEGPSIAVSGTVTSTKDRPLIAIVGGGFSGTMVAYHLARLPAARPPRVLLFEKSDRLARGVAYGTRCEKHLLNVAAGLMSALADEPSHFLDWLRVRDPSAEHGTFAPRTVYGDYLEELLTSSMKHPNGRVEVERDEVVDLELDNGAGPVRLTTRNGRHVMADKVVLALGHAPPQRLEGLNLDGLGQGYVADPWSADVLDDLDDDDAIALIGTGLTTVDLIVQAHANDYRGTIFAISRHGLFPYRHQPSPAIPRPHIAVGTQTPETARGLLRRVRSEVAVQQAEGTDWRAVVDSLRPVTQTLWCRLDNTERARFVRHLVPQWDAHRHRVAPQIDALLHDLRRSGRLIVIAGRVQSLVKKRGTIELSVRRRGAPDAGILQVRRVINCTGPARDVRLVASKLPRALLDRNIGRPGPLALGLDVSDSGALIGPQNCTHDRIYAVGPLLKERLWETTAVRELRVQSMELARTLIGTSDA